MSLVSRLPVKDHAATAVSTEPLGIHVVEILDVALQVVLASTSLLNILFPAEAAGECALLLRAIGGWW